jgi:hypothetical protein
LAAASPDPTRGLGLAGPANAIFIDCTHVVSGGPDDTTNFETRLLAH